MGIRAVSTAANKQMMRPHVHRLDWVRILRGFSAASLMFAINPAFSQQASSPMDAAGPTPFSVTYEVIVPPLSQSAITATMAQMKDELAKLRKGRSKNLAEFQKAVDSAGRDLQRKKQYQVTIASDGKSFLYKQESQGKLQTVVLVGDETMAYEAANHRLDVSPQFDGLDIRLWPYLTFNLQPLTLYEKPVIPPGVNMSDYWPMTQNDVVVGTLELGVSAGKGEQYVPALLTRDPRSGQIVRIRPSDQVIVSINRSVMLGSVQLPTSVTVNRFQTTFNPTPPKVHLSTNPVGTVDFEMATYSTQAPPASTFDISSYLDPDTSVFTRGIGFQYSPRDGDFKQVLENQLKLHHLGSGTTSQGIVMILIIAGGILLAGLAVWIRLRRLRG